MLTFIFWVVVLALFVGAIVCWRAERRGAEQQRRLTEEVEAYLRRLFGEK